MAGLAYKYIPLESATLIHRRHPRDIEPPGMTDIKNMIISRSDKTLTLRPDFDVTPEYVLAIGTRLKNGDVTETEFLNSVVGLYGTGELIWITSTTPINNDREVKCSILESGGDTVSVSLFGSGSSLLMASEDDATTASCELSSDDIINALTDIWPGCYIEFNGIFGLYRINSVNTSTNFIIDESPGPMSDIDFVIYRPHNILNSGRKANIQTFGSNIVYCVPAGIYNSDIDRTSGPFYTLTTEATSSPGNSSYVLSDADIGLDSPTTNNEISYVFTKDSPVTIDSRYFAVTPPTILSGETPGIFTNTARNIREESDWTLVTNNLLSGETRTISLGAITSDGTDLYISGEYSDKETTSDTTGFEVADGYSVGETIEGGTSSWTEYLDESSSSAIVTSGAEQVVRVTSDNAFGYEYWAAEWDDVAQNIYDNYADLLTRFEINRDFDSEEGYTYIAISIGYAHSFPHGIGIRLYTNSNSGTNAIIKLGHMSGWSSWFGSWTATNDFNVLPNVPYWVRIKTFTEEGQTDIRVGFKIWSGDVGDEPSSYELSMIVPGWTSGDGKPVLAVKFQNESPQSHSVDFFSMSFDTESRYYTDREVFVHKFDESETPTFTDVSPSASFSEYYKTAPFRTGFVWDDESNNLVLGFMNTVSYINWGISQYPGSAANYILYSSDGGANWSAPASMEGYYLRGLFYSALDQVLYAPCVVYTEGSTNVTGWKYAVKKSDDGGATWTDFMAAAKPSGSSSAAPRGLCGFYEDDTDWCIIFPTVSSADTSGPWYVFSGESSFTDIASSSVENVATPSFLSGNNSAITDGTYYSGVVFEQGINTNSNKYLNALVVDTDASTVTWNYEYTGNVGQADPGESWSNIVGLYVDSWDDRQYLGICPMKGTSSPNNVYQQIISVDDIAGSSTEAQIEIFSPVSDGYRSNVFSVLDGYLVLFGVSVYDSDENAWTYSPRMIVWTAPNTITNFSGVGSGVGEVPGNGVFLDARAVNGRIVTFETSSIGALVPRGIVADPWDYDVIYEGIKILSNPCVVEDKCYFIASDGLLHVTNGISVTEAGSSFDMSLYDDFNEDSPIWLIYSSKFKSLLVFYPESSDNVVYMINLATGSVSYMTIPLSNKSTSDTPFSVVSVENSSDQRVFISYDLISGIKISSDEYSELVVGELSPGDKITGIDSFYATGDDHYWDAGFETGNIFVVEEGVKVALKHVIIHTYTDTDDATDNPDIIVEVKSLEDTGWHGPRDREIEGAVTVTTAACTIDSSTPPTALTNRLGTANGSAITYNLPWLAANCRVYTYSSTYTPCTLVTTTPDAANEYQITGTQQIKVYGTNGHYVYCFCENEPFVSVKAGDYIESDEGLHRITSLTNYTTAVLDRYKASGTDATADHFAAEQMAAGHGQVKLGINKLVEGVQLKVRIVPRHNDDGVMTQPTVAKITGISLGYIPLGEKIVEATGG